MNTDKNKRLSPKMAVWLSAAGWILGALTMLLVKNGDVGQAVLSPLMLLLTPLCVITVSAASAKMKNQAA